MKNKLLLLLMSFFIICGLYACKDYSEDTEPHFTSDVIAIAQNNEMKIAPKAHLVQIAQNAAESMEAGNGPTKTKVLDAHVELVGDKYYLFASALKGNSPIIIAVNLVPRKESHRTLKASIFSFISDEHSVPIEYEAGGKHSCSGNNCESCAFRYDKANNITGCTCNKVGSIQGGASYCNHTVSQ